MRYVTGNLLDAKEDMIVHGCNAKGVMGSGVAKAIREKWPGAYDVYKKFENTYGLEIGSYSSYVNPDKRIVVNLVTQETYGSAGEQYVSYTAIAVGLDRLITDTFIIWANHNKTETLNIAIPMIGAGLGGGNWNIIENILLDLEKVWAGNMEFVVYKL